MQQNTGIYKWSKENPAIKRKFQKGRRPDGDVAEAKGERASQWRRELIGPSMVGTEKFPWD